VEDKTNIDHYSVTFVQNLNIINSIVLTVRYNSKGYQIIDSVTNAEGHLIYIILL